MTNTGRNDPCPCGSGKKYKKCCLRQSGESRARDQLESNAAGLALAWLDEQYGDAVAQAFRQEFLGAYDDDGLEWLGKLPEDVFGMLDINGRELVLAEGDLELETGSVRCLDLVFGPGGPLLDAVQRTYLEKLGRRPLGLYEVVESKPGEGFRLRDLLDEDEPVRWVVERSGSQGAGAAEGSVLAARLIPGPSWKMSGAVYPFPEMHVLPVLQKLRSDPDAAVDPESRSTILVDAWLGIFSMPAPRLVDASTGEETLLVNDHYRVVDWSGLEAALTAEPDVEEAAGGGWVRLEDPQAAGRRPRLAINRRKKDRIEAFARTRTLADDGRAWLERVAGDSLRWITREITDPTNVWDRRFDTPREPSPPALDPADLPAGFHQQLHEQLYREWPDEPVPALGDQTPRQAMKTPAGHRQVVSLLESYDRAEKGKARAEGRPPVDFGFLRQEIGLEE